MKSTPTDRSECSDLSATILKEDTEEDTGEDAEEEEEEEEERADEEKPTNPDLKGGE